MNESEKKRTEVCLSAVDSHEILLRLTGFMVLHTWSPYRFERTQIATIRGKKCVHISSSFLSFLSSSPFLSYGDELFAFNLCMQFYFMWLASSYTTSLILIYCSTSTSSSMKLYHITPTSRDCELINLTRPIILTPLDYHTPIDRPPKKRKKSAIELYDGMVKDGRLSRAGKTVTCLKCGEKGHNSRSCTVNPSTPAVTIDPSTQSNVTHSAPAVTVNSSTQSNVTYYVPVVTVNPSAQSNVTHFASGVRFSKVIASRLSPAIKTNSKGKRKVGE
ncbi:mutator type transposase [Tanacetum coccineum]